MTCERARMAVGGMLKDNDARQHSVQTYFFPVGNTYSQAAEIASRTSGN
jgi:hypothetical protein